MSHQTIINVLLAFVTSSPFPDGMVQSILHNAIKIFAEMQVVCYKEWERRKHTLSPSLQAEMLVEVLDWQVKGPLSSIHLELNSA